MIKQIETPFLYLDIKDGNCEVTGTGNTWQYLLLFAYIVRAAKEGRFTNGFDDEGEEPGILDLYLLAFKLATDQLKKKEGEMNG